MLNKNVVDPIPQPIAAMVVDDSHPYYEDPVLFKLGLAVEIQQAMKTYMTLSLSNKEQTLQIRMDPNKFFKNQKETIKLKDFDNYLNDLSLNFFTLVDEDDFQNGYILLLKAQRMVNFLFKKRRIVGEKEWLISQLNEIVFLQLHGLTDRTKTIYKSVLSFLKTNRGLQKNNIGGLSEKKLFGFLNPQFEKGKFKLRTLLSFCLSFSERFEHQKAIKKAEEAFNTALDLLILTLLVAYFYIFKNIDKLIANEGVKENRRLVKIEYFANFISILKKVICSVENLKVSKIKKSSFLPHLLFYERKLKRFLEGESESTKNFNTANNFYNGKVGRSEKENHFNLTGQNFVKPVETVQKRIQNIFNKYKKESDLIILNNQKVIESSFLNNTTILTLSQLNYYNYNDVFVTEKLKNEITENSLLEKISFVVISLYVLATEHRFLEHRKNSENPFYKFLFDYIAEPTKRQSELFLGKAVEIAFSYLSDNFPFVSQIFNVFKKFELNRSKSIPENDEDNECYNFLLPVKNGFKSELIIPVVKAFKNTGSSIFDLKDKKSNFESVIAKKQIQPKKRFPSYKRRTTSDKGLRKSVARRLKSSNVTKKEKTAVLMKNNNYIKKVKTPILKKNNQPFSKTDDNFFKPKKRVIRRSSSKQKKRDEKENLETLPIKNLSVQKQKKVFRPRSTKNNIKGEKTRKVKFSPIVKKYLSNKLQEKKDTEGVTKNQQIDINNVLQNNTNKLNINFTNVGNLNFVINSFTNNGKEENKDSQRKGNQFKINKHKNSNKKKLKKVFKNKNSLNDILNRFKNKKE